MDKKRLILVVSIILVLLVGGYLYISNKMYSFNKKEKEKIPPFGVDSCLNLTLTHFLDEYNPKNYEVSQTDTQTQIFWRVNESLFYCGASHSGNKTVETTILGAVLPEPSGSYISNNQLSFLKQKMKNIVLCSNKPAQASFCQYFGENNSGLFVFVDLKEPLVNAYWLSITGQVHVPKIASILQLCFADKPFNILVDEEGFCSFEVTG